MVVSPFSAFQEAIEGGLGGRYRDPRVLYSTTQSGDFCSEHSSMSKDYVRGKPAFDRLNANKTNYDLATSDSHYDLRTTSHAHHADPKTWEVHRGFEQPVVGGWTKANGAYCVDEASRGVSAPRLQLRLSLTLPHPSRRCLVVFIVVSFAPYLRAFSGEAAAAKAPWGFSSTS